MCTVTFIQDIQGNYILTSNRDEAPSRTATEIVSIKQNKKTIVFPQDPDSKGSWIAASDRNQFVCLLNGAFEKHTRNLPYKMSRGLVVLEFFKFHDAPDFFKRFDFNNIEPFTLIIFDKGNLYEFRWDESRKHIKALNIDEKHIWSSCTLYTPEWQSKRQVWFETWQKRKDDFSQASIIEFHNTAGEGDESHGLVINRKGIVRTISITSLLANQKGIEIMHDNLYNKQVDEYFLKQEVG